MGHTISVLVVDDDETLRTLLQGILEREGYSVATAESVQHAKDTLAEGSFQVVISDIKMPGENGYDLLRFVKGRYPELGVILMTGHGDLYSVKDAMLLGADEYLNKPFKSFEIALMVERLYWRMRAGRATSHEPTRSETL